jgi:hypothetical protein
MALGDLLVEKIASGEHECEYNYLFYYIEIDGYPQYSCPYYYYYSFIDR